MPVETLTTPYETPHPKILLKNNHPATAYD